MNMWMDITIYRMETADVNYKRACLYHDGHLQDGGQILILTVLSTRRYIRGYISYINGSKISLLHAFFFLSFFLSLLFYGYFSCLKTEKSKNTCNC